MPGLIEPGRVSDEARAAALKAHTEGRNLTIQGVASLPPELQTQYLRPGEVISFNEAGKAYVAICSVDRGQTAHSVGSSAGYVNGEQGE